MNYCFLKSHLNRFIVFIFLANILILTFESCSTTKTAEPTSDEFLFNKAMDKFNREDYLEAKSMFDAFLLQYRASKLADQAQYYEAEISYKREEFITAAWEYNKVASTYSSSPLVTISLFKAAKCYYELSPSYDRDQEYTVKAIAALINFKQMYSKDSLAQVADKYIAELRNKLAFREYKTAELYIKLDDPRAALIYYQSVLSDYSDTDYFEESFWGKIQMLYRLKKFDELKSMLATYSRVFPGGKYLKDVSDLSKKVVNLK
jgi:outer membrane protein assembly factor BamD